MCIAELIAPRYMLLKLYILSSIYAGAISASFTRRRGYLDVDVFLSQIFKFLALSFASFLFCFSVSLVINTSSSLSLLNGDAEVAINFCDWVLLCYYDRVLIAAVFAYLLPPFMMFSFCAWLVLAPPPNDSTSSIFLIIYFCNDVFIILGAVSYTHLTLPTKRIV